MWNGCADIVRGILGGEFDAGLPLMEAGLDSLGAVELRSAAANAFAVPLPATVAFDHPTVAALAAFIASRLPAQSSTVSLALSHSLSESSM